MSRHERFESNDVAVEVFLTPEGQEMAEGLKGVREFAKKRVAADHPEKPYHGPDHSEGVTSRVSELYRKMQEMMPNSFAAATPEEADKRALMFEALKTAGAIHDMVMRFKVENGKVVRLRGEKEPGGNEYESLMEGIVKLRSLVGEANPFLPYVERVIEQAVNGTYPDRFTPIEFPPEMVADYPENVRASLREKTEQGEEVFKGLRIDSSYTVAPKEGEEAKDSLPALLTSTSDLGDAFTSESFQKSGNAEFFETQIQIVKDCLAYIDGAAIPRARGKQILNEMKSWRKVQVGVALGQKVRLLEKYTPTNISRLLEDQLQRTPDQEEVQEFSELMCQRITAIDETVMDAADIYEAFPQFEYISDVGSEPFTDAERAVFLDSLKYVNFDQTEMQAYATHVKEAQERPPEELKLAA